MKVTKLFLLPLFLCVACQSGHVAITAQPSANGGVFDNEIQKAANKALAEISNDNSNTDGSTDGSSGRNASKIQRGNSISTGALHSAIYFSDVNLHDGTLLNINGIGFLSSQARTQTAYRMHPHLTHGVNIQQWFAPLSKGIAAIESVDSHHDMVSVIDARSLRSSEVLTTDRLRSLTGSSDGQWLAFIDEHHRAYVMSASIRDSSSEPFELQISHFALNDLAFQENGQLFAYGTVTLLDGGGTRPATAVFQLSAMGDWRLANQFDASQVVASPHGTYLAMLKTLPGQSVESLVLTNLMKPEAPQQVAINAGGLRWQDDRYLAYYVVSNNEAELRVADAEQGTSSVVAPLDPNGMALSQVVCPQWQGNDLFYATYYEGRFVIMRAQKQGERWKSSIFAQPSTEESEFVCPKALN